MQSQVDEIKSKLDIVDIVQEYFPLKQSGANFKSVCPFHDEKTPSFVVSREKQIWHCFGSCGDGGDMFTFIEKIENIDFTEALKILAQKAGVKLQYQDPKITSLKTKILYIHDVATQVFKNNLNSVRGEVALNYLRKKRGIKDQTIKEWNIGYANNSWDSLYAHLKKKNFTDHELLNSGLIIKKDRGGYYDRFRNRIMFPIEDKNGNIAGFTGRAIEKSENAKYVNSPETLAYNKSQIIFGFSRAKQFIKEKDAVVLVEGQVDVISSSESGVKNVVAVSGTAFTKEQVDLLKRYTNNFIFAFDFDQAGINATKRGVETAWQAEVNTKILKVGDNKYKDPDEIVRANKSLWKSLVGDAVPAMDYFLSLEMKNYNPDDISKKKEIVKNLLNLIIKIIDPVEQDYYLKKLSEELKVPEQMLRDILRKNKYFKTTLKTNNNAEKVYKKKDSLSEKNEFLTKKLLAYIMLGQEYRKYIISNIPFDSLPEKYHRLYNLVIIYYTKIYKNTGDIKLIDFIISNGDKNLLDLANPILLLFEDINQSDYNKLSKEVKSIVKYFKKQYIENQRNSLSEDIVKTEKILQHKNLSLADKDNNKAKLKALFLSYDLIIKELKKVEDVVL